MGGGSTTSSPFMASSFFSSLVGQALGPTNAIDNYLTKVGGKDAPQFSQISQSTCYRFDNHQNPPPPFVSPESSSDSPPPKFDPLLCPKTTVLERDCLVHAQTLVSSGEYKKVAVLNMANEFNCGGAWSVHWGSQEEYLFRNTTLPVPLWIHRRADQDGFRAWKYGTQMLGPPCEAEEDRWYPFTKCGGVFTPYVEVHSLLDKPLLEKDVFTISVLTIAAQDMRPRAKQGPFSKDLLLRKLRTLFHMAIDNECDALVLGAIGCGAFLNDPTVVAACFAEVLEEIVIARPGALKRVDFPVIKSKANLAAFQRFFPTQ